MKKIKNDFVNEVFYCDECKSKLKDNWWGNIKFMPTCNVFNNNDYDFCSFKCMRIWVNNFESRMKERKKDGIEFSFKGKPKASREFLKEYKVLMKKYGKDKVCIFPMFSLDPPIIGEKFSGFEPCNNGQFFIVNPREECKTREYIGYRAPIIWMIGQPTGGTIRRSNRKQLFEAKHLVASKLCYNNKTYMIEL